MCLFSWGREKSLLEIYPKYQLQRASGVFKLFPSWLCWGEYRTLQSTALILFYSFNFQFHLLIANQGALYLGKKVNRNDIFVNRPAEDITHPLLVSILDGLFLFCCLWDLGGEHMRLVGRCLNWAL